MVNKAFLSLAAVVLFTVFGTGVFVGMQVGGLSDGPGPAATDSGSQATATATQTDSAATPTATPSQDDGDTVEERESIPPREFNERNISTGIAENINDARASDELSRLSTTGSTAEELSLMASAHSSAMADAGRVSHTIDDVASADRYRQYDLYDTCQFQVRSFIESADDNDLEVVGRTYAGQVYPENGTQQFNENDTAVADALTDSWLSTTTFRERLTYQNAERMGVGVTITSTGVVYATVNVC